MNDSTTWYSWARFSKEITLVIIAALFFVPAAAFYVGRASVNAVEPQELSEEVTDKPREGTVISNVGEFVCVQLLDEKDEADNVKSCARKLDVFNFGVEDQGQPAVLLCKGDIYEVHRVTDHGVKDGLVFHPKLDNCDVSDPAPPPVETPESKETEDNSPTDLPDAGSS